MLTFVIGGARSGKSEYAERLAAGSRDGVTYVATAQAGDEEMRERIAAHRLRRPAEWATLEIPTRVGRHLLEAPPRVPVIVVECLTLLVSNRLLETESAQDRIDEAAARAGVQEEVQDLLRAVDQISSHWIIVSNEVGEGIVPAYPLGRIFRDLLGWANQRFARRAEEVILMVAGIPVPVAHHRVAHERLGDADQPRRK